jgi:hypothetical protein
MKTKKGSNGDCYEKNGNAIIQLLLDGESKHWFLCHGRAIGQGPIKGIEHGHCWLEYGDTVHDYSNGNKIVMRKKQYYSMGKIKDVKRYTAKEVRDLILKFKHWGPWE